MVGRRRSLDLHSMYGMFKSSLLEFSTPIKDKNRSKLTAVVGSFLDATCFMDSEELHDSIVEISNVSHLSFSLF
jgi:hypothetical protein